jgi:hypothetical protein
MSTRWHDEGKETDEKNRPRTGAVVKNVNVWSSDTVIHRIEFDYTDGTTLGEGVAAGVQNDPFDLNVDDGEHIVEVRGRAGAALDSVEFVTNTRRTSPAYGGFGGSSYSLKSPGPVFGLVVEKRPGGLKPITGLMSEAQTCRKIVQTINVRSGENVNQIEFVYTDGSKYAVGGDGGAPNTPFELRVDAGETIIEVRGHNDDVLKSIEFITSLGRPSPSYGGAGGHLFWLRHIKGPIANRTDGQTDPIYGLDLEQNSSGVVLPPKGILNAKQVRDRTLPPQ